MVPRVRSQCFAKCTSPNWTPQSPAVGLTCQSRRPASLNDSKGVTLGVATSAESGTTVAAAARFAERVCGIGGAAGSVGVHACSEYQISDPPANWTSTRLFPRGVSSPARGSSPYEAQEKLPDSLSSSDLTVFGKAPLTHAEGSGSCTLSFLSSGDDVDWKFHGTTAPMQGSASRPFVVVPCAPHGRPPNERAPRRSSPSF